MNHSRPYVLSIAGFDPSGGAGILADIKTFELLKTAGLGVCTAVTFQNDTEFRGVKWLNINDIKNQVEVLLDKFKVDWVKIGLIENLNVLHDLVVFLKEKNPGIKIIWDPIVKASAGFVFHEELNQKMLKEIIKHLFLITPNLDEITMLAPDLDPDESAINISRSCNLLLKGGHRKDGVAMDILYEKDEKTFFEGKMIKGSKRGTGCVLSAAIVSSLAKGLSLKTSCIEGKSYVTEYILSHNGLLGYHYV